MDYQKILTDTRITGDGPGTILRDFDTLLDFIGEAGIETSGKYNLLPMKQLATLNARLCQPIRLDLRRPQQKSYPPIQGLYLLLRVSGLVVLARKGKKTLLALDPEVLASWQKLNHTERYFALLEIWLFDMDSTLVDERAGFMEDASLQHWVRLRRKLGEGIRDLDQQPDLRDRLNYIPGLHNLALMRMFGLIELQDAAPEPGAGWHIESIRPTAFGDALLARLQQDDLFSITLDIAALSDEEDVPEWFLGKFQAFFPELQNYLELPEEAFREGLHTLRVALPSYCEGRFTASGDTTLEALSNAILDMVEFDDDHLYCFRYRDRQGRRCEVNHPYMDEGPYADEIRLGDLTLAEGQTLSYIFDFGDHWAFEITAEHIVDTGDETPKAVKMLDFKGKIPSQYGYDEDQDED